MKQLFNLLHLLKLIAFSFVIESLFELDSDKNVFRSTNAFPLGEPRFRAYGQTPFRRFKKINESNCVLQKKQATINAWGRERYSCLFQNNSNKQGDRETSYYIRNARFKDLTAVANMLVQAFYRTTPLLKNYHELREVDRLQSNFPYNDVNHCMYVAISKSDNQKIVGFVDIDFRTNSLHSNAPPRPYLSDLAVDENWRRKGIARDLILSCERKTMEMKKNILYLRVESENESALKMYSSLGYHQQPSNIFGVYDTTMLLKRDLNRRRPELEDLYDETEAQKGPLPLDYVV